MDLYRYVHLIILAIAVHVVVSDTDLDSVTRVVWQASPFIRERKDPSHVPPRLKVFSLV
jgi:hypothetical protein